MRSTLVVALVSCVDGEFRNKARRFLAGLSCDELQFIAEYRMVTAAKNQISLDGALLHSLRVPLGYWEAKDEHDACQTNAKRAGLFKEKSKYITADTAYFLMVDPTALVALQIAAVTRVPTSCSISLL